MKKAPAQAPELGTQSFTNYSQNFESCAGRSREMNLRSTHPFLSTAITGGLWLCVTLPDAPFTRKSAGCDLVDECPLSAYG
jgi:hypothetical protein